jgi:NTP pyrophosphatase (non-canonical NTP hydrolase)
MSVENRVGDQDSKTSVGELRQMVHEFVDERDWERFHAPKNISMALAVEAAELMEHFQWMEVGRSREIGENPERLQAVAEEIADVVCYAMALCNELNLDLATAMRDKMVKNRLKYPVEEARNADFGMDTQ